MTASILPDQSLAALPGRGAARPRVQLPSAAALRALGVVADPTTSAQGRSTRVDVAGEVAWIQAVSGEIPTLVLPAPCSGTRATCSELARGIQAGVAIVWLVGRSSIVGGEACLWLEHADGTGVALASAELATLLAQPDGGPGLVILAPSVASESDPDGEALALVAQGLAVPAVLILPGPPVAVELEPLLCRFFEELWSHGEVGLALERARAQVPRCPLHGWLTLLLRDADGHIWRECYRGDGLLPA